MVFTANGRQCIAAALAAVVPTGGRCGVEALTYPFIKGIAARLGITLVPLAMDEDGVRPDAVQKAHREAHLSALYVQPIIHNPLGMTMPPPRRADLLRVAEKLDLADHRGHRLRLSRRRAAAGRAGAGPLRGARQPVEEGGAGAVARLHRSAAAPARKRHGFGPLRRLDRGGLCLRRRQRLMGDGTAAELARLKRDRRAGAPADRGRAASPASRSRPTRNPIICG